MSAYDQMYECIINAKPPGQGVKIEDSGDFVVRTNFVTIQQSQKQELGMLWVIEYTVEQTSLPDKHPVGCQRSAVYWPMRNREVHPGIIKTHILACLGVQATQAVDCPLTPQLMQEIAEDSLLNGYLVRLRTERLVAKNGSDYTKTTWSPVCPGTPGDQVKL